MDIDWDSILGKYTTYIKSAAFKDRVSRITTVSPQMMEEAGEKMIELIQKCAMSEMVSSYGSQDKVPDSIQELLNEDLGIRAMVSPYEFSISSQGVKVDSVAKYQIDIGFSDTFSSNEKLYRPSLRWKHGTSPYKGINNIISLFDTGYTARSRVYGYNRHDKYVTSSPHRDGMAFMAAAVEMFNQEYGDVYNCYAYISADPQFYIRK